MNGVCGRMSVAGAAAAVLAAMASAPAVGAPVAFENPAGAGHFTWAGAVGNTARWLDVTLPASSQTFTETSSTVRQRLISSTRNRFEGNTLAIHSPGASQGALASSFSLGHAIPDGGLIFSNTAWMYNSSGGSFITLFPEGVETYIGVQFPSGSDLHYGWVGVVRTGFIVDAFAWGYETTPNTPIAAGAGLVPAPGAAVVLGMTCVFAARRRR